MNRSKAANLSPNVSRPESKIAGACLVATYLLLAVLPVVLAYTFPAGAGTSFLRELGKGAGLLGFSLLTLQVVLAARLKFVERPFGLDLVMYVEQVYGREMIRKIVKECDGGNVRGLSQAWLRESGGVGDDGEAA